MSWWYGRDYESVDQKRRKAAKLIETLRKKHPDIKPVCIEGRTLAKSFWGKAWCKQMDLMADHDNRLPRGRSYARNGAICHLDIRRGEVEAWISGTHMYTVRVRVKPLAPAHWERIQAACRGKIATMLDLLQGKLSKEVMAVVADPESGIFPKPDEIDYDCSCPDWAKLCKHAAAVFYGIGNRLDEEPELLFLLRHADPVELFSLDMDVPAADAEESALGGVDLGNLFGIELLADAGAPDDPTGPEKTETPATLPEKSSAKAGASGLPELNCNALTGPDITALREAAGLSQSSFASRLDLTQATIWRWEKETGIVGMFPASRKKIQAFYKKQLRRKR
jgi:hypothetical protein